MPYDEELADRVRAALGPRPGVTERRMFGGVAFLLHGKMFCGVAKGKLMVRVGPDAHAAALKRPHAAPMDFTGRPMKGYVFVLPAGAKTARAVRPWVEQSAAFVATLGPKKAKRKTRRSPRAQ